MYDDNILKIVILGEGCAEKTSIIYKYLRKYDGQKNSDIIL